MPVELSSNWKKLQAQIKAESSAATPGTKTQAATAKTAKNPPGDAKKTLKQVAGRKRPPNHEDRADGPSTKKKRPASKPSQKPTTTAAAPIKATKPMGVTQSSQLSRTAAIRGNGNNNRRSGRAPSPSLALWAADHDISAEDLAQAYGLAGVGRGSPRSFLARARGVNSTPEDRTAALAAAAADDRENAGLTPGLVVGKYVALDCEMVGVESTSASGHGDDALARVSMVDFFGRQVYDTYVQLQRGQRVVDWRTAVSGVTPRHVRAEAGARPFAQVRAEVAGLLAGRLGRGEDDDSESSRILVGHDVRHDLRVLALSHPPRLVRDTARFSGFKKYGNGPKPALRVLARTLLGVEIQQGAHSSVEDARITMELFRLHKPAFDVESANKFRDEAPAAGSSQKAKKKKNKH